MMMLHIVTDMPNFHCTFNPSMPSPKQFLRELKLRNVRKTMTIYVSSALTTIGVVRLFMEVYGLPAVIFPIIVSVLTCGVGSALLVGWHHGAQGPQKIQKKEIALHSVILLAAVVLVVNVVERSRLPRLAAAREGKSIAVLPFKNMSDNKEDEYFSDGMTEDILTQISKISDLRVVSRTSVMKYKDTHKSIREIGDELGVAAILEGSVRRANGRVRIVGQLIDAISDEHLWAETYDRELRDVFAIQSEVAQQIANALKAQLSTAERERIDKKATENLEAYTLYLKGRDLYNHYKKEDNESAISFFREALALDPSFALAYAGLGDAFGQRVERFHFERLWLDSALAMADNAIALDPNIAEPYKARGVAYFRMGKFQRALAEYGKAVEINPNYGPALANLGSIYWYKGRYDEALRVMKRNVQVNPTRASGYHSIGLVLHGLTLDSAAERWFAAALRLQPDFTPAEAYRVKLHLTLGNMDSAKAAIDTLVRKFPGDRFIMVTAGDVHLFAGNLAQAAAYYDSGGTVAEKAFILVKEGRQNEADRIINKNIAENMTQVETGTEEFTSYYELARLFATQGEEENALRWLRKAIDAGWLYVRWTRLDPLLENLRAEPGFIAMLSDADTRVSTMRMRVEAEERARAVELESGGR